MARGRGLGREPGGREDGDRTADAGPGVGSARGVATNAVVLLRGAVSGSDPPAGPEVAARVVPEDAAPKNAGPEEASCVTGPGTGSVVTVLPETGSVLRDFQGGSGSDQSGSSSPSMSRSISGSGAVRAVGAGRTGGSSASSAAWEAVPGAAAWEAVPGAAAAGAVVFG
ncbi:hypothetical protein [Actinoplanes philippinensis]|uniref:hypothetical protein n=1 Tax=Actinoplanes philippinensis TaxID=35752 RepID=UPI001160DEF3|nr:hypothetical protein [Actinoplanes philippinensis]